MLYTHCVLSVLHVVNLKFKIDWLMNQLVNDKQNYQFLKIKLVIKVSNLIFSCLI